MFDGKGNGDAFFHNLYVPVTYLTPAFFFENLLTFGMGPKMASGKLTFMFPMKTRALPMIASADVGACAYSIFQDPDRFIGQHVPACGELLTGPEIAGQLSRVLGTEIDFKCLDQAEYSCSGVLAADYWYNAFQFVRYYNDACIRRRDPAKSREVNPNMQSLETWLSRNQAGLAALMHAKTVSQE